MNFINMASYEGGIPTNHWFEIDLFIETFTIINLFLIIYDYKLT